MLISTKGRYALRVMLDLAEQDPARYTPLKDIAARQDISQKYLEGIMTTLSKAGLIEGLHGKGGGYRLQKKPEQYTAGSILRLTEGSLAPVACLSENAAPCEQAAKCRTLPMWRELNQIINDYLNQVTLADLLQNQTADNYII